MKDKTPTPDSVKAPPATQSAKRKRASEEDVESRLEMIIDLIIQGVRPARIRQMLATSQNISPKQAERYIDKARSRLASYGNRSADLERAHLAERLNHVLSIGFRNQDYSLVQETLKSQLGLLQLDYKYPRNRGISHDDSTSPAAQSRQAEVEAALRLLEEDESPE